MKKFYALLLAAAMIISMAACGSTNEETANNGAVKTGTEADGGNDTETVKLNIAYMPNYASLWSVLTAIDQGY